MGVDVDQIEKPFEAALELVKAPRPAPAAFPRKPEAVLSVPPVVQRRVHRRRQAAGGEDVRSRGSPTVARWYGRHLDRSSMPPKRSASSTEVQRDDRPPGQRGERTADRRHLSAEARDPHRPLARRERDAGGLAEVGLRAVPASTTRRSRRPISQADLASQFDTIVLPDGTSRNTIVNGLSPERNDKEWAWAYGVGDAGWKKLGDWVRGGGTLSRSAPRSRPRASCSICRSRRRCPEPRAGGGRGPSTGAGQAGGGGVAAEARAPAAPHRRPMPTRALRDAFSSPGSLDAMLRDRVIDPTTLFYCPGSLLQNEFNTAHPVAFGMPAAWPIFFEGDQAYRLKPGFTSRARSWRAIPTQGPILQSGWLLGEDLLRDQANVVAFHVGKGYVVTMGSQVDFRAQPRATFKLIFNAMFHGPSTRVPAAPWAGNSRLYSLL